FHHVLGSVTAPAGLPTGIWHLCVQMAQKSCRRKRNHLGLTACVSVQAAGSSARMRLSKLGRLAPPNPGAPPISQETPMSKQWFFAANGQQQGPCAEAQFRDLIASGSVRADTLVWTEGMAGWQRAGEIPGLMASSAYPPSLHEGGAAPMMGAGAGNPLT